MICPSCNKLASSFFRYSFSFQGVSFAKSIRGYLMCQSCGTLLRVTGFGTQFWVFFTPTVIVLAVFVLFYRQVLSSIGPNATPALWMVLVLVIVGTLTFGLWRFARVQRVESEGSTKR